MDFDITENNQCNISITSFDITSYDYLKIALPFSIKTFVFEASRRRPDYYEMIQSFAKDTIQGLSYNCTSDIDKLPNYLANILKNKGLKFPKDNSNKNSD